MSPFSFFARAKPPPPPPPVPAALHTPPTPPLPREVVASRLRAALWSFFAGDALSCPSHWYYGGLPQIQQDYGPNGLTDYTKPVYHLKGSIMNKSNLNGGGRASSSTRGGSNTKTIIGDVINHGKKDLWAPSQHIHYHATLQAGENSLEAQLARVLMQSIVATGGVFDADNFRQAYVDFMQRPGSHHDAYASSCHRLFFANLVFGEKDPKDCPDTDHHNVDTVDGLVLPTIVGLAAAARQRWSSAQVGAQAAACASVTRLSNVLELASEAWATLLYQLLLRPERDTDTAQSALRETTRSLGWSDPRTAGEMEKTACYLGRSMPALLDSVAKYSPGGEGVSENGQERVHVDVVWKALLENANTGGENVHRGSCLGATLGLQMPTGALDIDDDKTGHHLQTGLYDYEALRKEIDDFVAAVVVDVVEEYAPQQE